jgi:hypothetical protein
MVLVLVYYALKRVVVVYWGIVFHKVLSFFGAVKDRPWTAK